MTIFILYCDAYLTIHGYTYAYILILGDLLTLFDISVVHWNQMVMMKATGTLTWFKIKSRWYTSNEDSSLTNPAMKHAENLICSCSEIVLIFKSSGFFICILFSHNRYMQQIANKLFLF